MSKSEPKHDHNECCSCGTTTEAIHTAMKIYEKGMEHQCPIWMAHVSAALSMISAGVIAMNVGERPASEIGRRVTHNVAGTAIADQKILEELAKLTVKFADKF